jgi:hypothetical protein
MVLRILVILIPACRLLQFQDSGIKVVEIGIWII